MKPCFACRQSSPLMFGDRFFDPEAVFESWSAENQIICDWRSRFDGVRRALDWASLDESDDGAHAECALRWAIKESKWDCRYPRIPAGLNALQVSVAESLAESERRFTTTKKKEG